MPNITLSVDAEVIRKVRRVALDHNTTLTAMVRSYLVSVADSGPAELESRAAQLRRSFTTHSAPRGPRAWHRGDLHER